MNKIVLVLTIFSSSVLLGCTSTGVIQIDKDAYMIGKKDGAPGLGISLTNKAEVYKEANEFCSAKNLEVETLRVVTEPARPAQLGYTELQFKCVPRGSSATPLLREPDTIIELRKK